MKINPAKPPKGMEPTVSKSDQSVKSHPSQAQSPLSMSSLESGSLLKGLVAGIDSKGNYLLKTELGTLSAQSLVSLDVGKELFFEVVKGGSVPLLTVSAKAGASFDIIRLLLPGMLGFAEHTSESAQPPLSAEGRQLLSVLVENSIGPQPEPDKLLRLFSWLNKGANIQQHSFPSQTAQEPAQNVQLSELISKLQQPGIQKLAKLLDAHTVFNNQALTTAQVPDQEPFLICPCFFSGEKSWGEWLFSFEKNETETNKSNNENYAISFYLNMSRLGQMFLKVQSRKNNLQGQFSMASPEAVDHVQRHLPQLTAPLEHLYERVSISCQYSTKSSIQTFKDELASTSSLSSYALVDCTV